MSLELPVKAAVISLAIAAAGCAGLWGFEPLDPSESSDAGAQDGSRKTGEASDNTGFGTPEAGDGAGGGAGDGAAPLVGTWACTETVDISYVEPSAPDDQTSTAATLTIVDNGDRTVTATTTTDAGPTCSKRFALDGNGFAILEGGQSCTFDGLIASYSTASLTATGTTTLNETEHFDLDGTLTWDGGPVTVVANATSSATCTRSGP